MPNQGDAIETDVLICGGGVIGLAIAYQLSMDGQRVVVVDREEVGRQTSWAAAGILPPSGPNGHDALGKLRQISYLAMPKWIAQLASETGIDLEHRAGGGIHLARAKGESAALAVEANEWESEGIDVRTIGLTDIREVEPNLRLELVQTQTAYFLPEESSLRTPRYLIALQLACKKRGVEFLDNCGELSWQQQSAGFQTVNVGRKTIVASRICFSAGSWTRELAAQFGVQLDIHPYRGQMLLFRAPTDFIRTSVINEGPRYVVPRNDGHVLVGSTVEDVGYDLRTTESASDELKEFAFGLFPKLAECEIVAQWAGLRPKTGDGWPFLGRLPGNENVFVAAGHFRNGISLSPGTAIIMSRLIRGEDTGLDMAGFRLERK